MKTHLEPEGSYLVQPDATGAAEQAAGRTLPQPAARLKAIVCTVVQVNLAARP
jgi:hypothetical protein